MNEVSAIERLYEQTHQLGDEYYRIVDAALEEKGRRNHDCEEAGVLYWKALKNLADHLASLEQTSKVQEVLATTRKYIDLVEKDLSFPKHEACSTDPRCAKDQGEGRSFPAK